MGVCAKAGFYSKGSHKIRKENFPKIFKRIFPKFWGGPLDSKGIIKGLVGTSECDEIKQNKGKLIIRARAEFDGLAVGISGYPSVF